MAKDSETPGLTRRLAQFAGTARLADLDPADQRVATMQALDSIACILAGSTTQRVAASLELAATLEGSVPAENAVPVVGLGTRAGALSATYAMAAACHALEYDDGNREGSVHPGAAVVPAALAVAYHRDASYGETLDAIMAGYEVCITAAEIMNPQAMARGFQLTPVGGVLGAAAAAGRLLGLDADGIERAIGVAGSASSGTFAYLAGGGDVKKLHPAHAARSGVHAAYAEATGLVTGPRAVLEGPRGLIYAFAGLGVEAVQHAAYGGQRPAICRSYIKPYPCCRHVQSAVEALAAIVTEHGLTGEAVARIEVETYAAAMAHAPLPWDTFEVAQLSFPYLMAVTATHGTVGLAHFDERHRTDAALADLAARTVIREASDLSAAYPAESPARVHVTLRDGRSFERTTHHPPGAPEARMSDAAFVAKFAECARLAPRLPDPDTLLSTLLSPELSTSGTPMRRVIDKHLVPAP
ncbi:MmgE/PrpD family protein [Stappia stellulata]|uniref:MmgE/PrpD family protein n=1 Tax=Stappia stellulata TaxID=71235 RepID=UPI00040BA83E|nr:MmgE/PrpD family protein [Stappia stellulata]